MRLFLPCDTTAVALGADGIASAIMLEAARRSLEIELVRNGSRGMFWLEPLLEVERFRARIGAEIEARIEALASRFQLASEADLQEAVSVLLELHFFRRLQEEASELEADLEDTLL